jgi:hypothetical protein
MGKFKEDSTTAPSRRKNTYRRRHCWPAMVGLSFRPELLDSHLTQTGLIQPMPALNHTHPRRGDCANTTPGPPPTSRNRSGRLDPTTTHSCAAIAGVRYFLESEHWLKSEFSKSDFLNFEHF